MTHIIDILNQFFVVYVRRNCGHANNLLMRWQQRYEMAVLYHHTGTAVLVKVRSEYEKKAPKDLMLSSQNCDMI